MNTEGISDNEQRYSPRQIAERWGVNYRTVHRWVADGLPADNVGSVARPDWRIRLVDVSPWLASRAGLVRDTVD